MAVTPVVASPDASRPVRVFFPCTGLGRQRRGFETFTTECAFALKDDPRLAISGFAGGGRPQKGLIVLRNFPRDAGLADFLARVTRRDSYFWEQASFFVSFLPHLVRGRPDVVYFADINLGNLCWHWRRLTGARYRLLFYNGGAMTTPYTRMDFIQQLTPAGLSDAISRGEDPLRQMVLPHGVRVPDTLPTPIVGQKRASLGLPVDRPIILSVGMLDATVKRMDYLIREVAAMPAPRPHLVLLGAESVETAGLRTLAAELLGAGGSMIATVDREKLSLYYRAADVFASASLREGFGLSYVEALLHGLPVVAHDSPVTRYVLDVDARFSDLTVPGAATKAIHDCLAAPVLETDRLARYESARDRFGWDELREQYAQMLIGVSAMPL